MKNLGLHTELHPNDVIEMNGRNSIQYLQKDTDGSTIMKLRLEAGATVSVNVDSTPVTVIVENRPDSSRGKLCFQASRSVRILRKAASPR